MSAVAKVKSIAEVATPPFAVSKHWVTLPNEKLYRYVAAGDPARPTLVLLHGYTDSWRSFEQIIPLLQEHFHVIALDQRGHGDTGAEFSAFNVDDFAVDAISFIAQLSNLPVHLLGHSLGSLVAQRVAAAQPDLIGRLVLIGAADTAHGNPAIAALQAELADLTDPVPAVFAHDFQSSTLSQPIAPRQLATFVAESQRVPLKVWRAVARSLLNDRRVVTPEVAAETLILWGDRDSVFDSSQQQRLLGRLRNVRHLTYHGVGHAPHWEKPEAVAQDVIDFLGTDREQQ
ncbi:MAG TPA: alpha/beta hydrolase [Dongiaceae bacterium]|nr:alpha/beta hydrolase [Dongiaceae bacterium]